MQKIQELFDPSKQLNRKIESVVTFAANSPEALNEEIKEYVVIVKKNISHLSKFINSLKPISAKGLCH